MNKKNKLKIGILCYRLDTLRGGTKLALTLGKVLSDYGYEVAFSGVYEKMKELEKSFGHEYNFKVYKPNKIRLGNKIVNISCLWNHSIANYKIYKAFKPDVVIEIGGILNSLFLPILLKIPRIHYCIMPSSKYATLTKYEKSFWDKFYLKIVGLIEKIMIKRVNLVTMSKFVDNITQDIWGRRGTIINPPIDVELFKPSKNKKNVILSVCRYDSAYKLQELVKIFRKLKLKNYELHFVAQVDEKDEPYYNKLKEFTKKDKNIILNKNIAFKGLLNLYKRAKIFWYSSWSPYGFIIAEAQSAGIPVVTFGKNSGPGEIIINKKTGYALKDGDFKGFYDYTKKLLDDNLLYKKMSEESRKNALNRLGLNTFSKSFINVIKQSQK